MRSFFRSLITRAYTCTLASALSQTRSHTHTSLEIIILKCVLNRWQLRVRSSSSPATNFLGAAVAEQIVINHEARDKKINLPESWPLVQMSKRETFFYFTTLWLVMRESCCLCVCVIVLVFYGCVSCILLLMVVCLVVGQCYCLCLYCRCLLLTRKQRLDSHTMKQIFNLLVSTWVASFSQLVSRTYTYNDQDCTFKIRFIIRERENVIALYLLLLHFKLVLLLI